MSGFFSKFIVASKEGARTLGEFSVDANEIRFSTQEIANAKQQMSFGAVFIKQSFQQFQ